MTKSETYVQGYMYTWNIDHIMCRVHSSAICLLTHSPHRPTPLIKLLKKSVARHTLGAMSELLFSLSKEVNGIWILFAHVKCMWFTDAIASPRWFTTSFEININSLISYLQCCSSDGQHITMIYTFKTRLTTCYRFKQFIRIIMHLRNSSWGNKGFTS